MPLLVRLYVAHVAIIPGLILAPLRRPRHAHQAHAISPEPTAAGPTGLDVAGEEKGPFTHHLRRIGAFALILLTALGALAILLPPGVGPTPVEGIEVTRPLWMFTLENLFGLKAILAGSGACSGC
ncbi:MAG: hypothetical protein AB7O29_09165 [Acidimicrobiia bacterium]